jgi:DdrB-like protein
MENTESIQMLLRAIASHNPPSWQRPLKDYSQFDWTKIGATVVSSDAYGATKVSWCGHLYTRRSGENKKFGAAIWFSRANARATAMKRAISNSSPSRILPMQNPSRITLFKLFLEHRF